MSTFRGLWDVYVNPVMLKKCQSKQLVLNLTVKGTAGEYPGRHHHARVRHTGNASGIIGVAQL